MWNVEILDVEKSLLTEGCDEGLGELVFTLRNVILGKVERDKVGPVKIFLTKTVSKRID